MKRVSTAGESIPRRASSASAPAKVEIRGFVPPYPPSWFDRFCDWMDRLPIPRWAFLSLLALGSYIFLTLLQWGTGGYPVGTFNLFNAFFAASIPYMLGLLRYLDQTGDGALGEMRPALRVNEAEFAGLRYRLTTLPRFVARSAGLLLVMTVLVVLAIDYLVARLGGDPQRSILLLGPSLFQVSNAPLSLAIAGVWLLVSWWMSATVILHSVHQLRTINEIYTRHTEVDIFHLGSLYALSRHTLRTAIGILLFLYAFVATAPGFLDQTVSLVSTGLLAAMAVLVFALPLVGVHRMLVREKERQLDATAARLKSGLADLHRRVDQGRLARMDDLHKAVATLEIERTALARIPTWPWEPGTIRGLAAAVILPLALWLAQFILEKAFGG